MSPCGSSRRPRRRRGTPLRPRGRAPVRLRTLASQVLTELEPAIKTVRSMGATPQQALKLGYTIGAGLEIVPKLLRTHRERQPSAATETGEFDVTDPWAGLRDNLVNAAVVRPPLGLPGLASVELAAVANEVRAKSPRPDARRPMPGQSLPWHRRGRAWSAAANYDHCF